MIKRTITKPNHLFAKEYADKIMLACKEAGTKSRFNTDKFINEYLGYLGEAIFHDWLEEKGLTHEWQANKFGESDEYDFLIKNKRFDVKTNMRNQPVTSIKSNFQLLLHADQVGLHADFYFWI